MILTHKNVGETPLELLERIRREQSELFGVNGEVEEATLSYAGRLDPMAEGLMMVLVGDENRPEIRTKFLGLDKEYVATFFVGAKTDTGDCLGLVQATQTKRTRVSDESIVSQTEKLKDITKQVYPWFSGKTVDGIKLFDHFKAGKTDADIERPVQNVEIKKVEFLGLDDVLAEDIKKYIFESIGKVHGDFRQKEILEKWAEFFTTAEPETNFQTFDVRFRVSSGTFIRALTENFDFPVTLLKLNRTAIL